jgi:hypothetical protein
MVLSLSALIWIILALREYIGQVPASFAAVRASHLVLAALAAIVSVLVNAYVYFLVLCGVVPTRPPVRDGVVPFLGGQLVRYLPGKIWGMLYLTQATGEGIPARYVVRAGMVHLGLTLFHSVGVALCVYAYYSAGPRAALPALAALGLLVYGALRADVLHRASAFLLRDHHPVRSQDRRDLLLLALLEMDWLFYLVACALMLPGRVGLEDSVVVAAAYAVAWLVGALAFILPGGLLVREGSFLWLSGQLGFPAADMFMFSVVARVLFTLADVVCAALGAALAGVAGRKAPQDARPA